MSLPEIEYYLDIYHRVQSSQAGRSSALQLTECIQFDENKNPVIIGKNGLN